MVAEIRYGVESIDHIGPTFTDVYVAKILGVERHPNADRLNLCDVDAGAAGRFRVVCGAPNARVGIRVPLATVGAELPPGEDGKPFKTRSGETVKLGEVLNERQLHRHRTRAGLRIGDERHVDLLAYAAWLARERQPARAASVTGMPKWA